MSWENIDRSRPDSMHYSVARQERHVDAMAALREFFPNAEVDDLNFILFSTSGVHGSYCTIEDCEAGDVDEVTYLIVHPRLVGMRYGNVKPETPEDFEFLKKLRAASHKVVQKIGMP